MLSKFVKQAKLEGRVCARCGWIINKKNWLKGYRLCAGCWDGLKGVNVSHGHHAAADEPIDRTGNAQ